MDIQDLAEEILAIVRENEYDDDECIDQIMDILKDFKQTVIDENL